MSRKVFRPSGKTPKSEVSPFVHRFKTDKYNYVYDVNTRRILRVGAAVWDIIEDFGKLDATAMLAKHSGVHSRSEILDAMDRIDASRQKGLLLSNRPLSIEPAGRRYIQTHVDGGREQLIINVTEECNFRCSYCVFGGSYEHYRGHSPAMMTWDVARAAIDDFLRHSGKSKERVISFYGGEPLLNLRLVRRCVKYARNSGLPVRFGMTTNGLLLKGAAAKFLGDEDFMVVISLDGPAEEHDLRRRTKGGKPTWQKIIDNLRKFVSAYPAYSHKNRLRFNAVVDESTDMGRLQEFFSSFDLFTDSMGMEVSQRKKPAGKADDDLFAGQCQGLYDEFKKSLAVGKFGSRPGVRAEWLMMSLFAKPFIFLHKRGYSSSPLPAEMTLLNTCIPGARRTFVNVRGDYFACERVVESDEGCIGNVVTGVDVDKVKSIIDKWHCNRDECRTCWCLDTCRVGCFASIGTAGRISRKEKAAACKAYRNSTDGMLAEYCRILERRPKAFDFVEHIELS